MEQEKKKITEENQGLFLWAGSFRKYDKRSREAVRESGNFLCGRCGKSALLGRVLKPGGTLILGDPSFRFKMLVNIFNFFMKCSKSGDVKIWHRRELING